MRNNTKKGFTLVELLVVIAILAILATVSVVGYTSFIERAAVSNDENLAAQLNNFMIAIKADHTSEFYNQEVTPDNARDFVYEALVLGNLEGKLKPDAADHGYHFYYDLKEDKIVVLKDAIDDGALLRNVLAGLGVAAVNYDILDNPATCFTKQDAEFTKYNGIRYVFLDTEGSELAELINLFYNVNSAKDFARLQELATKALFDGKKVATLETLVNKSIFVGTSGSYVTSATNEKTLIFGTTMSGNKYQGTEKMEAFATPSTVINVPNNIKFFTTNSLNFATSTYDANAATHTTVLHFNMALDELAKKVDPNFTNVVFTLSDNKQYACANGQIICLEEGGSSVTVTPKNPLASFDFEIVDENSDYIYNNVVAEGDNVVYIAWDAFATGTTFNLTATKTVGANDDLYGAVSGYSINWSVDTDSSSYLTLVNANGEFKFTGTIPAIADDGSCVLKVNAKDEIGGAEETFEIRIVRIAKEQTITMDGKSVNENSVNTLVYSGAGKTYDVSATANFTYADVITNGNIKGGAEFKVVSASSNLTYANKKITVVPAQGTTNETLKFYYGNYEFISKDLVLYDSAHLPYGVVSNYADFVVAHSSDLKPSDFFTKTQSNWTPLGTIKLVVSTTASNDDITAEIKADTLLRPEYVSSNKVSGMDTSFKFLKGYTGEVTFYLVHDYNGAETRVSPDFTVHVVEGKNVRTIADLEDGVNNVLLTNLVADETYAGFTLTGKTLYGNQHYIDLRGYNDAGVPFEKDGETSFEFVDLKKTVPYAKTLEALITLKSATLDNVKIVGEVYKSTDFIYQTPNDFGYGASLVKAEDGSTIVGCYLANTRSPLKVTGTVTVENTVLFGGNYANIDVASTNEGKTAGELILKGTVTTINQITDETPDTIGAGIVVDMFANKDTKITIESANTLVQYNYAKKDQSSNLPVITYTMDLGSLGTEDINVFMGEELDTYFTDSNYASYVHNNEYINTGIIFTNGVQYNITGWASSFLNPILSGMFGHTSGLGDKLDKVPAGYEKTYTTVVREKSKLGVNLKVTEYVYVYTPTNGNTFNNVVPEEYMPSYILGEK